MTPKYPNVKVQLSGTDGNGLAILGRVDAAMKKAGIDGEERKAFLVEATRSNYDHLLQTAIEWVEVS